MAVKPKRYSPPKLRRDRNYLFWYFQNQRRKRGTSFSKNLLLYINGLTSKVGPDLLFSSVDDSDPLKYDDGSLYIGPAFTNELPSGAGDFSTWVTLGLSALSVNSFTEDAMTSRHGLNMGNATTVGTLTYSILAKSSDRYLQLLCSTTAAGGASFFTNFNLVDGSIGSSNGFYNERIVSVGDGWFLCSITFDSVSAGESLYALSVPTIDAGFYPSYSGDGVSVMELREPQAVNQTGQFPYILPGTTQVDTSGTSGGNGYSVEMNEALLECYRGTYVSEGVYTPIPMTTAVLVKMGVGSDYLVANSNILDINNQANGGAEAILQWQQISETDGTSAKSSDSTTKRFVYATWDAGEIHLKLVQVSSDGLTFRVGNKRYSSDGVAIDSAIVWSSWGTYDGSFDPLDYIRYGYGITVAIGLKAFAQFNIAAEESVIVELMEKSL